MELAKAVAATFAVVGQEMPDIGLATIVSELLDYPLGDVLKALARCRKSFEKLRWLTSSIASRVDIPELKRLGP